MKYSRFCRVDRAVYVEYYTNIIVINIITRIINVIILCGLRFVTPTKKKRKKMVAGATIIVVIIVSVSARLVRSRRMRGHVVGIKFPKITKHQNKRYPPPLI